MINERAKEISLMYQRGIKLNSGKFLTIDDITEIRNYMKIVDGIRSYEYISEICDTIDDIIPFATEGKSLKGKKSFPSIDELPINVFKDIYEYYQDAIEIDSGEDERNAVYEALVDYYEGLQKEA